MARKSNPKRLRVSIRRACILKTAEKPRIDKKPPSQSIHKNDTPCDLPHTVYGYGRLTAS
ncbi:exported protein of unknown function [Ruminococcaceae bacterium BL-6]|nr:exported protein of unknown function [Ruminococcaceae bacterium BL-6]